MISSTRFASSFTSFWQELLPNGEAFVRMMNLDPQRFEVPLDSNIVPTRRAIVNEIGFAIFSTSVQQNMPLTKIVHSEELLTNISADVQGTMQNYRGRIDSDFDKLDIDERNEAIKLAQRIKQFFKTYESNQSINLNPRFVGCGFVNDGAGDLIAGDTLYEIKAGDRSFRLVDIRQMLVYLALNHSSPSYEIENVGFMNPRTGLLFEIQAKKLIAHVSGMGTVEFYSNIIEFISSGGVSR